MFDLFHHRIERVCLIDIITNSYHAYYFLETNPSCHVTIIFIFHFYQIIIKRDRFVVAIFCKCILAFFVYRVKVFFVYFCPKLSVIKFTFAYDLVIIVTPKGKRSLRRVDENQDMHTQDGILRMADVVEAPFGSEVCTTLGVPYRIQKPTLNDIVKGVKRQTQILYPKDIGYICMRLGVGPNRTVIEAGTGSGSLTVALSWFSGTTGKVHTFEAREEFHKLARRNLEWAGVGQNVTMHCQDIAEGFGDVTGADALFLDVRTPWDYLKHIPAAVTPGAALAFLLPTVDQVGKLLLGLEQGPFDDVEVCEILVRRWKPIADRLRPEDRMVAHTGFLIFARHQERSAKWDECRTASLGTRERKQEAARRERLGLDDMETASEQIDE